MERTEILEKINLIFRETLDDDDLDIVESTTADQVEDWDSLTHIQLIVAIEKGLNIRFSSKEIQSWPDVGSMLDCIEEKIA